jgi:multidrug efflux pump subunit AcrA (membrane-fusion protein)
MRVFKNLLTSVWVWLIVIAAISYVMYSTLQKRTTAEERVDLGNLPIPTSAYVLSKNGTVEIEGGIVQVSAPRTGIFKEVYVKEGDFVEKGQLLAIQEDRDDKIAIRRAEIAIENARIQDQTEDLSLKIAERDLERAKIQRDQDAISQQQYDSKLDALDRTKLSIKRRQNTMEDLLTQLETARFNLEQRKMLSPIKGKILESVVTAGAGVSAENVTTAFQIIPDAPKRIRVKVDETGVDKIYIGQIVDFTLSTNRSVKNQGVVADIGEVFSSASNTSRAEQNTVDVIIQADTVPYRLGQTVLVQFKGPDGDTTDGLVSE